MSRWIETPNEVLRPFWRYYGGKWRAAPRYPQPQHDTIVEPFAGAAGYSLRHYQRNVILIDKYHVIAEIWRYLIAVSAAEVLRIPLVDSTDDLPSWVPQGGKWLVGFAMNAACATPRKNLSAGRKKLRETGRVFEGWSEMMRARVASQVEHIRHWRIIEGDYTDSPHVEATWFVDPPYEKMGKYYKHSAIDYTHLSSWCRSLRGQVMVCENDGASWLPFRSFAGIKKSQMTGSGNMSYEAIWTQ